MGQSSNDVFPSAVHLAAVDTVADASCCPRSSAWPARSSARPTSSPTWSRPGRTHMMDAVPVTLGQEFGGYAAQIPLGRDRVRDALGRACADPARRHRHGHGPQHPSRVRRARARAARPRRRRRATASRRRPTATAWWSCTAALKGVAVSLTKIANDLVLMGSGPRTGLVELRLPELQKGSSIMPGKVNPVIPEVVLQVAAQVIGNDTAVTVAGTQGNFELNVRVPMMARNVFESIRILTAASHMLAEKCVDGIEAERGDAAPPRGVDAGDRDRAQPAHRLRPRHRDRQGGRGLRAHDPRGGAREGRGRGDARQGARPARDGARLEEAARSAAQAARRQALRGGDQVAFAASERLARARARRTSRRRGSGRHSREHAAVRSRDRRRRPALRRAGPRGHRLSRYGTGSIGPSAHLEVQVRPGGVAGRAHVAEPRAAAHALADPGRDRREVGVPGGVAEPVADHHEVAVAALFQPANSVTPTPAAPTRVPAAPGSRCPVASRPPSRGAPKPSPIGAATGRRKRTGPLTGGVRRACTSSAAAPQRRDRGGTREAVAPSPRARWKFLHGRGRHGAEDAVDRARADSRAGRGGTAARPRPSRVAAAASSGCRTPGARAGRARARVCGPATPSTASPRRRWKRTIAALVSGPRTPSTVAL